MHMQLSKLVYQENPCAFCSVSQHGHIAQNHSAVSKQDVSTDTCPVPSPQVSLCSRVGVKFHTVVTPGKGQVFGVKSKNSLALDPKGFLFEFSGKFYGFTLNS